MDLWLASHNEIKAAALKYFREMPSLEKHKEELRVNLVANRRMFGLKT